VHFERPEIIRPPSERHSYYLPLTSGCSNNTCTFCNYYGCRLSIREVEEVKAEINALALFLKSGFVLPNMPRVMYFVAQNWDQRRLFLQDGDALVYPFPKLIGVLEYLNEKLPQLERVGTYATPKDVLRRSVAELKILKELKLGIIYMGVESGDEEILRDIGKRVNYQQMVTAGKKVREAGITLSVTVILGLGGVKNSRKHALATAQILSEIDPDYAGALTLTLVPGTPLYEQAKKGGFELISPFASLEELKILVENAHFTNCFFSSMHASNYLSVRGWLPQDKEKMVNELARVLANGDASMLRPEFLRGL
jgi:radical SAM superfamily enzyme YgiQ (UPF0313 family)